MDPPQCVAKNVRRLYGLSPDNARVHNDPSGRRASVHGVYGRYYTHLAGLQLHGRGGRPAVTLFDYVRSVGLAVRGRATDRSHASSATAAVAAAAGPCGHLGAPSSSPPRDVVMLARLPATEYLRGGQCAHADGAVVRFDAPVARVRGPVTGRRAPRCDDGGEQTETSRNVVSAGPTIF